ncbi:MAG TPA: hypothetical protein VM122_10415 [Usitatibacter sp.]|nr:hypothetical protein [Usitatibacter sp.]
MTRYARWFAALAFAAALPALAANDRFYKEAPGSMNGFMPARDALYVKECGSCHFPYSPGLLPARSWELYGKRFDKHFGDSLNLSPETHAAIMKYLVDNAADRSKYEGSMTFMERIDPQRTPYRFRDVPLFMEMHRVIVEVIDKKPKVKVRKLSNCNGCHQGADEGSFGYEELVIPGLTVMRNRRME